MTKPETKQPEYAMESAVRIRVRAMTHPCEMREWREVRWEVPDKKKVDEYIAEIIASTPAVKKLVEAARLQVQNFERQNLHSDINNLGDDDHEAWEALLSALKAFPSFKDSTGGG